MQRTNRIAPQTPAQHMKTYQVVSPVQTHHRAATCEEVRCPNHLNGFKVAVDEGTELGAMQAGHIRRTCVEETLILGRPSAGVRRYGESRDAAGLTVFTFPAGQECFGSHTVPLERPANYLVREGDWRGNPRGSSPRVHRTPEEWVEDFAEHQDRLNTLIQKG